MNAFHEILVGLWHLCDGAVEYEIGQLENSFATVEAIVPFLFIARQMFGADSVVGAGSTRPGSIAPVATADTHIAAPALSR